MNLTLDIIRGYSLPESTNDSNGELVITFTLPNGIVLSVLEDIDVSNKDVLLYADDSHIFSCETTEELEHLINTPYDILINNMFEKYMIRVREQLECNATEEYQKENIVYLYSNKQVNDNLDYFRKCMLNPLSGYKALLFFHDYLNGEYDIS
jgi:hypothetical protein